MYSLGISRARSATALHRTALPHSSAIRRPRRLFFAPPTRDKLFTWAKEGEHVRHDDRDHDLRDDDGSICFYGIHYQNFGFQKKITFAVAIFTNQPLSVRYCHESLPNALGFQLMWKTQQHRLAFWIASKISGEGLRFHSNKRGKKLKKQQNCCHKNCNISLSRMS